MAMVAALAQPPYWKVLVAITLVLLPLSYLGYVAWPKWRQPVTPRRRVTIALGMVGISLLLISERLEFADTRRWLGVSSSLLGCALIIVSGLRGSDP